MTAYFFSNIDADQALNYNGATDTLNIGGNARNVTVQTTATGVTLILGVQSINFGPGFLGFSSSLFGDGSKLFVGASASESLVGSSGRDQLLGGDGADSFSGLAGDDSLSGGTGDDVIDGGLGGDVLDGGDGVDLLSFASLTLPIVVSLLENSGGEPGDRFVNFEGIEGSGLNDQITGDSSNNLLRGGAGADSINGLFGSDTVEGGRGVDALLGGGSPDRFVFALGDSPVGTSDTISDWDVSDSLQFAGAAGPYQELAVDSGDGLTEANALIAGGAKVVAVRVAAGVIVYADAGSNGGSAEDAVLLSGRTLDDISGDNIAAPGPTGGADSFAGGAGPDTIFGGAGNDTINGGAGQNYLRGDDGADSIVGGTGFDDANGNMGNDTVSTGAGEDYCVGGKDNDSLSGGAAYDLVYGNLGADTCFGDDGDDIVRGGQDNDIVNGGTGADFVSGDKGSDTMTGGTGADIFHTFGDAGLDRVTDFNLAQGDRVQLDPGTVFTVTQVGANTIIDMTGGGQMILVNVQMSTLTPGWIFGA